MSGDEDGVRASRVLMDSLKANGIVQGKDNAGLAEGAPRNRRHVFQVGSMQDTSCNVPRCKGLPALATGPARGHEAALAATGSVVRRSHLFSAAAW